MKKQKLFQQVLMKKKLGYKTQNFYLLLTFLSITITLLIAFNIYYYLIEQNTCYHFTSNELKQHMYWLYKLKMSNKIKGISIKNLTYYFFDDIINITSFDPINIKTDEKSYKNIFIYYIGSVTIKDSKYVKISIVNPLYLIISNANGYFEEINKKKVFDGSSY